MNIKNKMILLSILLSLELFAAPSGIYVEVGSGVGRGSSLSSKSHNYSYNKGYLGSLAIGYQANLFRFEIEMRHKEDRLSSACVSGLGDISVSGDLVQDTQMLNFYYSGYNSSNLVATIGAGVGITTINLKDLVELTARQDSIKESNIPSYQAMFSVGYSFNDSIIFTTKYSYFHALKSDLFKSHSDNIFTLSLRYLF